jgi:hypothetical protein
VCQDGHGWSTTAIRVVVDGNFQPGKGIGEDAAEVRSLNGSRVLLVAACRVVEIDLRFLLLCYPFKLVFKSMIVKATNLIFVDQ